MTARARRLHPFARSSFAFAVVLCGCALSDRFPEPSEFIDVPAPAARKPGAVLDDGAPVSTARPPHAAPGMPPPSATAGQGGSPTPVDGSDGGVSFTEMERALYQALSPLGEVPPNTTNAFADNLAAASLGRLLFFDPGYSGPITVSSEHGNVGERGRIACATCHWGPGMDDPDHRLSVGTGFHTRNAPTVVNSVFYRWVNWGGRFSAPWELSLAVVESPVLMNSSRLAVVRHLRESYGDPYALAFGPLPPEVADASRFPAEGKPKPAATATDPDPPDGAWESMTDADRETANRVFVNYGKAIEAYLRRLVSRNSPFDQFVAGDGFAISEAAQRGLQLFVGRGGCIDCHSGPHFSDGRFHALGVPQVGEHVPLTDDGRWKDIPPLLASPFSSATSYSDDPDTGRLVGLTDPPPEETRGQFRTPSLRGVADTPPYMHTGQFVTLEEAIDFHDQVLGHAVGPVDPLLRPLFLSDEDMQNLVEFLNTLTGEPVPQELLADGADEGPPFGADAGVAPGTGW